MKRSNRLVARSAVALSLAASLTACGTASSTTTTAASSEAATETASEAEACVCVTGADKSKNEERRTSVMGPEKSGFASGSV